MAQRGIISGYLAQTFAPDRTITRAEFAAITVRALGLGSSDEAAAFVDVPVGSWFYDFARTAHSYGIIQGRGEGVFDPDGPITRQEAALMVSRAAGLCGLVATLDETAIRNILAPFVDYRAAAPWAAEALAFCCHFGIIDDTAIELRPTERILRGETAEMVYSMLRAAYLI